MKKLESIYNTINLRYALSPQQPDQFERAWLYQGSGSVTFLPRTQVDVLAFRTLTENIGCAYTPAEKICQIGIYETCLMADILPHVPHEKELMHKLYTHSTQNGVPPTQARLLATQATAMPYLRNRLTASTLEEYALTPMPAIPILMRDHSAVRELQAYFENDQLFTFRDCLDALLEQEKISPIQNTYSHPCPLGESAYERMSRCA
jgi:hypothetical protein